MKRRNICQITLLFRTLATRHHHTFPAFRTRVNYIFRLGFLRLQGMVVSQSSIYAQPIFFSVHNA